MKKTLMFTIVTLLGFVYISSSLVNIEKVSRTKECDIAFSEKEVGIAGSVECSDDAQL